MVRIRATTNSGESVDGNGVVIQSSGTIVTERSLLLGAKSISVVDPVSRKEAPAIVRASDSTTAIAVLQADLPSVRVASLAAGDMRVGESVWVASISPNDSIALRATTVRAFVVFDGSRLASIPLRVEPETNGAALVNAAGIVLGVVFSSEVDGEARTYAIPARSIAQTLGTAIRQASVANTAPASTPPSRATQPRTPESAPKSANRPVAPPNAEVAKGNAELDPADLPSVAGTSLPRDAYLGRFERMHPRSNHDEGPLKPYDAALALSSYNEAYANVCAKELASVPTTKVAIIQQSNLVRNGFVVKEGRPDTTFIVVRKDYADTHITATRTIMNGAHDLRVLAQGAPAYIQRIVEYRTSFESWLRRRGCRAPEVVQLEENLARGYGHSVSLQSQRTGVQAAPLFHRGCAAVLNEFKYQRDTVAPCTCARDALRQSIGEDALWDLEDAFTSEKFLLYVYSRVGIATRVGACLG